MPDDVKKLDDGGPAFPVSQTARQQDCFEGMTLRDWFAGQALTGMAAFLSADAVAARCYALADKMLAERAKGGDA